MRNSLVREFVYMGYSKWSYVRHFGLASNLYDFPCIRGSNDCAEGSWLEFNHDSGQFDPSVLN